MATVQSFFPIFHWHVYKKKREGGREGSERISRQVNCRRALCHAGGLLSSEAWKRRRNSPWVFWLQAPFVFSATLSLVGFLSARHMAKKKKGKKKKRYEAISRAMQNHIFCPPAAFLLGVTGLSVSIYTPPGGLCVKSHTNPPRHNRLVMVLRVGSWSQWILVMEVNNICFCFPNGTFSIKWGILHQSRRF